MTERKFNVGDSVNWGTSKHPVIGKVISFYLDDTGLVYEVVPEVGQTGWFDENSLSRWS